LYTYETRVFVALGREDGVKNYQRVKSNTDNPAIRGQTIRGESKK